MAYAAVKDMVDLFNEHELSTLTAPDDERTSGPDVAKIERALSDATDLVDSHLRDRYTVPLTAPISPMITRATANLARLMLASESGATVSKEVKAAYDGSIAWLKGLASGQMSLDGLRTATGAMTTDRSRTVRGSLGSSYGNGGLFGCYEW